MSISVGRRLGAFEILSSIGAGGMGEVYKAKDTRLDRIVAIKVLPEHLADSPERKQRFEREAKAISQLNHPHICTLHDIGRDDGIDFIVMEYIEGQTLRERLKKGALPLDQALEYGSQIADGLDKAHRAGIVHRDLKPANVILSKSGVKLLDFGLAKFAERGVSMDESSDAPTQQKDLTDEHTVLGTLQYMAPEQLESKSVDARTDIFALGALLYEMVTGSKAFSGESQASLIGAILKDDPAPLDRFQPMSPRTLDHIVRRCLEKDPDARWQATSDVMRELDWIRSAPADESSATPSTESRLTSRVVWLVAGAAIAGAGVWLAMSSSAPQAPPVVRSVVPLEDNQIYAVSFVPNLALSPDGKRLVYVTGTGAYGTPYVRELDQLQATPIQGTDVVTDPFFSPDGRWMGFRARDTSLNKVALSGGAPVKLHPQAGRGASWGPDGEIVFTMGHRGGLWQISADGGEPEALTTPDRERGEKTHRFPDVLPDGSAVIFTIGAADIESFDDARIAVVSLETGEQKILIEGGSQARFVPPRHLVYARDGSLLAIPFDVKRLEVVGSPTVVVSDVLMSPSYGHAEFSVSLNGSLAWVPGGTRGFNRRVAWVDRKGAAETIIDGTRAAMTRVSPDGERLVIWMEGANDDVWIYELARGTMTRLVMDWDASEPIWAPDGQTIAFSWERDGLQGIFSRAADGSGEIERLTAHERDQPIPTSWTPDGRFLVYGIGASVGTTFGRDLWTLPLEGDPTPRPVINGAAAEGQGAVSVDGRWLAYTSDESGRNEVYVQPFPDGGGRWQISSDGGNAPTWSRDGRELFFLGGLDAQQIMAVSVAASPAFRASVPQMLFEFPFAPTAAARQYDVAPDGRFVVIESEENAVASREIYLATNWATELNRLVPAEK